MSTDGRHVRTRPILTTQASDQRTLRRWLQLIVACLWLGIALNIATMLTSTPGPSAQPAVARPAAQTLSSYHRCEVALAAAYARWQFSGANSNPAECDQPTVTGEQYLRAWRAVGGETWTLVGATSDTTHTQH